MSLPWIVAIAIEYVIFRRFFAADLLPARRESAPDSTGTATGDGGSDPSPQPPTFALAVVAMTLIGFAALEPVGVAPAWVALAGALVLGVRDVVRTEVGERARVAGQLFLASNPTFCAFVFALGIVVLAVRNTGLGHLVADLAPSSPTIGGLLIAATLAAVLANLLNNLPATLLLVPVVAHSPGLVFAVLLGVNIGPNLTYVGSLATLLWREVLHARDHRPDTRTFLALGALTVPACLVATCGALWLTLHLTGTA
jgi:arsenical pump membrane protein